MNKKLILITLSVVISCSVSFAQKVIKNGNAVIIDCSNMKPKFYDASPKSRTTNVTDDDAVPSGADDIGSPENNAKVYKKFEVHKTSSGTATWRDAIALCANLKDDGGGWRLPVQKELWLIYIFEEKLRQNGISSIFGDHWSATNTMMNYAYNTNFTSNKNSYQLKNLELNVRCIRDL